MGPFGHFFHVFFLWYNRGMKKNSHLVIFGVLSVLLLTVVVFLVLNFGIIKDILIGFSYRPSAEMSEIRESLNLTGKGGRIFNASLPEIRDRDDFEKWERFLEF